MILFTKLFDLLKSRGFKAPVTWLREQGLSPTIVNKLSKLNIKDIDKIRPDIAVKTINSDTIDRLCSLLACQPGDIMEHIPDLGAGDSQP